MKLHRSFKLLALCAALAGAAWSQSAAAANVNGTANAAVLQPIAITAGQTLEFGSFAANGAGTVVIAAADGSRSSTGSVVLANSTYRAGTFNVTGTGNATFGVTYPGAFTISNGAQTMSVSVTGAATGTLASGSATVNVGGTVTAAANQTAGAYTGSYTMTVEYN